MRETSVQSEIFFFTFIRITCASIYIGPHPVSVYNLNNRKYNKQLTLTEREREKREYYVQKAAQYIHTVSSLMDQGISTKHKATRRACEHKHIRM